MKAPRAVSVVLSAFFGVRRGSAAQQDRQLRFADIVAAAIIVLALLIGSLLLLVNWLTAA